MDTFSSIAFHKFYNMQVNYIEGIPEEKMHNTGQRNDASHKIFFSLILAPFRSS